MEPIFTKDLENKTLIIEKIFSAPKAKVWEAWTTEKILEKWWWPKQWPATSMSFDFKVGGHWHYYMQGPDGTKYWWWVDYAAITPEISYEWDDAFSDEKGVKSTSMPQTHWHVAFFDEWENTKIVVTNTFKTAEQIEENMKMWFKEWFTDALDNLDIIFAK